MKTKKHVDRKTRLEQTLRPMRRISGNPNDGHQAWLRLLRELEFMSEPESRMPQFNKLLGAIWTAATNES